MSDAVEIAEHVAEAHRFAEAAARAQFPNATEIHPCKAAAYGPYIYVPVVVYELVPFGGPAS